MNDASSPTTMKKCFPGVVLYATLVYGAMMPTSSSAAASRTSNTLAWQQANASVGRMNTTTDSFGPGAGTGAAARRISELICAKQPGRTARTASSVASRALAPTPLTLAQDEAN